MTKSDTIPMAPHSQWPDQWRDVRPGEGCITPSGAMVIRINPRCEFAQDLMEDERKHMGVVIWTDDLNWGDYRPGTLIVIGPDTPVRQLAWHGERTPIE